MHIFYNVMFIHKPFGIVYCMLMIFRNFPLEIGGDQMDIRTYYARRGGSDKLTYAYEGRGEQIFATLVRVNGACALMNDPCCIPSQGKINANRFGIIIQFLTSIGTVAKGYNTFVQSISEI